VTPARVRSRRANAGANAFERFQAEVEPALAAVPRVHRFAQVPVVGDAATPPDAVAVWIDSAGGGDPQVTRASLAAQTVGPAAVLEGALDRALAETRAPWVLLLHAGDALAPPAVERFGQAGALAADAALITCDEDVLDPAGHRRDPSVRPGPSPDLLLERDVVGSTLCVRPLRALAVERDRRYGLALRLAGPHGAGQAHVPALLCHRTATGAPSEEDDAALAGRVLAEREGRARVQRTASGGRRVRYPLSAEPEVEVVVLFRDRPELLRRCCRSVLERSTYERLRLCLIDNGSVEAATAEVVAGLEGDPRVRVLRDPRPFNFAALCNAGAGGSSAEVLVFLNNDTEVLTPGWVEELLEHALREEAGAVAPLLTYPDDRVQHAGAALGMHGYAGHPFAGLRPDQATPFGTATDGTRNWLAVTAACLMVERRKFEAVGRFDERFVVAGNDVDLCLRLTGAGHRSLCVPHVRLLHDESRSRGSHIDPGDFARSEESYGAFRTVGDPFYNPSLTLTGTDCALRRPGE
jgi:GT2 family glycosyltransferase